MENVHAKLGVTNRQAAVHAARGPNSSWQAHGARAAVPIGPRGTDRDGHMTERVQPGS